MASSQPRRSDAGAPAAIEAFRTWPAGSPLIRWFARLARRFRRHGRRSSTSLCIEGGCYLLVLGFVFLASMLARMNLMLVLVGMMLGPLLMSWRLVVLTLRGLEVRRRTPPRVCAGDLLVVNVELNNPRARLGCWAAVVRDQIRCEAGPGRGGPLRPALFFLHVPAGQSREAVYRGRLPQRGRYRLGPIHVFTRFPFGLFQRRITFRQIDALTVFPRQGRLSQRWIARHHEEFEGTQRRERRHARVTGDYYGVREWRQGDSRRWIHWRSSARHGTLVVRQFEQHRNRDVALLVDLWQPDPPAFEDLENVELAVSFAATVVADLCRKGGSNLLLGLAGAEPECIGGPASLALLQGVMERLAVAEASSEDRLPALLDRGLSEIEPGTEVVLISTRESDLSDRERFPGLAADAARRSRLRRLRTINTASDELNEYFQAR